MTLYVDAISSSTDLCLDNLMEIAELAVLWHCHIENVLDL